MRRPVTLELNGGHRGGLEHARLLATKTRDLPELRLALDVAVVDPYPGRAPKLATALSEQGVKAFGEVRPADDRSADIKVLAIDDAEATGRLLARARDGSMLVEPSILVSAPTLGRAGGVVLGIGAVLPQGAQDAARSALDVFGRIAAMAPAATSRRITSSALNSSQMRSTRRMLHDRLTAATLNQLTGKGVPGEVFVVDGLTSVRYPLATVEASGQERRRDLVLAATHEIAPSQGEERLAVAFLDPADPRMIVVFARSLHNRFTATRVLELPPSPVMSEQHPLAAADHLIAQLPKPRTPPAPHVPLLQRIIEPLHATD
jgi:hypothetical protein